MKRDKEIDEVLAEIAKVREMYARTLGEMHEEMVCKDDTRITLIDPHNVLGGTIRVGIWGVYMITHTKSKKRYIGRSVNVYGRYLEHHKDAYKRKYMDKPLYVAMRQYGYAAFTFEMIHDLRWENSYDNLIEQRYIHQYNSLVPSGYNLRE